MKHRILALLLTAVMLIGFVVPVSAQDIINITDYDEGSTEAGDSAEPSLPAAPPAEEPSAATPTQPEPPPEPEAVPADESSDPPLGFSGGEELDEAALLAEMEAWLNSLSVTRAGQMTLFRAAPGDTGTVVHSTISIRPYDVTVPGVGRAYGSVIWRMKINSEDAFCLQIWKLAGGTYTAGEATSGNGQTAQYIANYMASGKSKEEYVAAQVLVWESLYGDIGIFNQSIRGTSFESAYNSLKSASAPVSDLIYWTSNTGGQEIATFATGEEPVDPPVTPPGDGDEDDNPNTHTEVTTDSTTRTEIRSSTEYEYSDGIGQITVTKRDQDGKSLDGAIFNIVVEFANGQRGGDSAFEVHNGSRLFTWTHPADDHQPAKVTVTEVRTPEGYVGDPTPQTAIVHPTYTRVTKVLTHTITITTTTTTTTVIDIDSGEVLAESSASSDAETELNPPTVQEYTDFIEGDRETTLTFVNTIKAAELVIFKYTTGKGTPLEGAQFEVSYVDPAVHSGRWTVTTGADGKAVISLPKPGAILIHEVSPPAGHIISPTYGPDTTVTIRAGERKQVDIPNDPYTAVEVTKIDSVTGQPLAGATISLKHITSGMEFRQVTDSSGIALFENVEPGSYYVEEIKAPDRYVLNTTRYPVELRSNEAATVTIPNDPYTGIEVTKVDANNGQTLAGAYIRLKHISSGQEYSGVTGGDGVVYFGKIPPGDYYVEEVQAPHGYVLNDTRYPLELKTGELATLTLPNYRKDGLYIRKVDENGRPLAGAVFELRRGSGAVLLRETTDQNGLIYRGFLTTDTYVVEEVQAPVGYLMDENNPQSIFIDETDDNKEYVVTFVNKRKPAIEIVKVDANDPAKKLQGAVFRISEQGGSKTWDITTGIDGIAVLENLEIGVTYIVEETQAPAGYVNSGYREAVVLDECRVHTITVSNGRSPKLRIEKIDEATGNKLPGAVFRVAMRGGKEYKDYTTGIDGTVTVEGLVPGWYTVTETRAPSGYVLDDTPREIEVVAGETAAITVNNNRKPSLTILKIDETTKQPLQYAKFRVALKEGKTIGEFTTDAEGRIFLDNIAPGLYVIEEIAAPDGYNILDGVKEILIEYGENAVVECSNQPVNPLLIKKVDSATGEPLPGAKFLVTKVNGEAVGEYETGRNGFITVTGVAPGWYTVKEIKAPEGYVLNGTPKQVELKLDAPGVVEFENSQLPGLHIKKIDAVTKEPLAGARFRITEKSGDLVGEYTTDAQGSIAIPALEPGWYSVEETAAPEGYQIDGAPRDVELRWGQMAGVEFVNNRLPGLQVKKLDAVTGAPLSGAKFRVEKMNGKRIGDFTTNSAGFFVAPDLAPGWYTVYETQAPAGYVMGETPQSVELKANGTAVVEFVNTPLAGLQIKKVDDVTGQPMAGVTFDVAELDGKRIGTFTTDESGLLFVPELREGWLVVTETKTLPGYKPDSTPRNVEIRADRLNTLVIRNQPYPILQIKKVDSETGKAIAGVKFKLYGKDTRELGEFATNEFGVIRLTGMEAGSYFIRESAAAEGYVLDNTLKEVTMRWGQTTEITVKNIPMETLRLKKVDSETGDPLPGAGFILYDDKNNIVGEYTSDESGLVVLPRSLPAGQYKVKEVKAPKGYVLLEQPVSITLKAGETREVEIPNDPIRGTIQIVKKSTEANPITKDKAGATLAGAVFEIVDEKQKVVDKITTDKRGVATSIDLPVGRYAIREIKAPDFYLLDDGIFYAEIKLHGDMVSFEVLNTPAEIAVTVEKRGDTEAKVGELVSYTFSNIANAGNVALDEFYLHDQLPAEVRLETLSTGVWSQRQRFKVEYRTNLKTEYRVWKDNLLTTTDNQLAVADLKLAKGEYITDFRLVFGTVEPGFCEKQAPSITARVLEELEHETRIVNKADAGGKLRDEWVYATDSWVTIAEAVPKKDLPRTGL